MISVSVRIEIQVGGDTQYLIHINAPGTHGSVCDIDRPKMWSVEGLIRIKRTYLLMFPG